MLTTILIFHVLAATIWTGGHIILSTLILPKALKHQDPEILLEFEQGFEMIGIPALLFQVASGLWISWQVLPDLSQWFAFDDFTSIMIGTKLSLLAATAGLALDARFRVVPNLRSETLVDMAWHIIAVTIFSIGFAVVGVTLNAGGL